MPRWTVGEAVAHPCTRDVPAAAVVDVEGCPRPAPAGKDDTEVPQTPTPFHRGGSGPPLVLLHGASMSWRAWRPVLAGLQRHHQVFAPTMVGHRGGAPWAGPERIGLDAVVDGVCAQLDEAGLDSAHVVGNSLGGWVAIELARRGRARTCTALSPAGAWRHPLDLVRLVWMFRLGLLAARPSWLHHLAGPPALRRVLLRHVMEHGERVSPQDVRGLFDDLAECVVMGDLLDDAGRASRMAVLRELPCPIRIAWAERDRTIPYRRYGAPMRSSLPGAEFVRLPGCGHVPMWDDPDLVVRTVLQMTLPDRGSP